MIKRFVEGATYSCRSACDHNCVWTFTVQHRTAKTVWLHQAGTPAVAKQFRVRVYNGVEQVSPLGRYSMAPVLTAA